MQFNFLVRIKNKTFWLTIIPALLLCVQAIAAVFGYQIDFSDLSGKLVAVVDAVFAVLTILGVAIDPTTKGLGDSNLAMTYLSPKEDEKEA